MMTYLDPGLIPAPRALRQVVSRGAAKARADAVRLMEQQAAEAAALAAQAAAESNGGAPAAVAAS